MNNNRHSQRISSEELDQAKEHVDALFDILDRHLIALTSEEKQEMPKMGPKTLSFVEKTREFALENPALVPKYMSMEEFGIDFADAHGLWALLSRLQQLTDGVGNCQFLAGSEAYKHALLFYNSVKTATAQDVPGAGVLYHELRKRFPGAKKRSNGASAANDLNEA